MPNLKTTKKILNKSFGHNPSNKDIKTLKKMKLKRSSPKAAGLKSGAVAARTGMEVYKAAAPRTGMKKPKLKRKSPKY
jgi:hypothetical protein